MKLPFFKTLDEKVQEDTDKLIERLKLADMRTLVMEMSNDKPFSENIIKKQERDSCYGSTDRPSWFAYRVSDELEDPTLKGELMLLLEDKDFSIHRGNVLRCLTSLCVNCEDYELFDFLISELKKTDDEQIITTVLSRLGELRKPASLNIDYLKELIQEGSYQNRVDAAFALWNSEHPELEVILISEFKVSDRHMKGMICATLRSTGTSACFEALMAEHKRTRSGDLKWSIETAINDIKRRLNIQEP